MITILHHLAGRISLVTLAVYEILFAGYRIYIAQAQDNSYNPVFEIADKFVATRIISYIFPLADSNYSEIFVIGCFIFAMIATVILLATAYRIAFGDVIGERYADGLINILGQCPSDSSVELLKTGRRGAALGLAFAAIIILYISLLMYSSALSVNTCHGKGTFLCNYYIAPHTFLIFASAISFCYEHLLNAGIGWRKFSERKRGFIYVSRTK